MNDLIKTASPTKVPHYKLRRLAQRAARVLSRHSGKSAALDVFRDTLMPLVDEYITLYDASMVKGPGRGLELIEGEQAVENLRGAMGSWRGPLARDVPKFSAEAYSARSTNPDDVIADAKRMIALVEEQQAGPSPLPYADQLITELSTALAVAEKEWVEAQDALATQQEAQADVRRLATAVQKELVALRSTLRNVIGSAHRDYQKLRLERATVKDDDDDDDVFEQAEANASEPGEESAGE